MTHKGENYSVKMQKYYFCNGTISGIARDITPQIEVDKFIMKAEKAKQKEIHHRIKTIFK